MKNAISTLLFLLTFNFGFAQVDLSALNKPIDLINKASINFDEGNYSKAISLLEASIKLDSTKRDAFTLLNHAYYITGNKNSQIKYLKKAKSIYADDDEFPYHLGRIYQQQNKLKAAVAEYDIAIKFSKINGEDYKIVYDYYANRGICLLKQNLYAKSITDFDNAIKLNDMKGQDAFESPDFYNLDDLLTEEHKLIRASMRDFVKQEISPNIEEWAEKDAANAEKEGKWEKHWEKENDPMKPKKLGGGKRPRPFKTPDPEDEISTETDPDDKTPKGT